MALKGKGKKLDYCLIRIELIIISFRYEVRRINIHFSLIRASKYDVTHRILFVNKKLITLDECGNLTLGMLKL